MAISYKSRYEAIADLSDAIGKVIEFMDDTSILSELDNHVDREGL